MITKQKKGEATPEYVFSEVISPRTLTDILNYFAIYFLEHIIRFRTCKHCGKKFALLGKSDTVYCNRVNPNGKTCKEIGANKKYRAKSKEDPIMQIYNKAYKRYFAWIRYNKWTPDEFKQWSKQARDLRDLAYAGEISLEDFNKKISIEQ